MHIKYLILLFSICFLIPLSHAGIKPIPVQSTQFSRVNLPVAPPVKKNKKRKKPSKIKQSKSEEIGIVGVFGLLIGTLILVLGASFSLLFLWLIGLGILTIGSIVVPIVFSDLGRKGLGVGILWLLSLVLIALIGLVLLILGLVLSLPLFWWACIAIFGSILLSVFIAIIVG